MTSPDRPSPSDFLRWSSGPADSSFGGNRSGRNSRSKRFAVYENLCAFCGFAIGTGSFHANCVADRVPADACTPSGENIYENICTACHFIYDGDTCAQCEGSAHETSRASEVSKPVPTVKPFGKQFAGLFESLRQKFKEKANANASRKPKIEIVHNLGEVFKTNETFDLSEIVQLKSEREQSVYGKLRNSRETVATRGRQISASESNFFVGRNESGVEVVGPPFDCESFVSDTVLYGSSVAPPSYEDAIHNSMYKRVSPLAQSTPASSFYVHSSSSSASSSRAPSVECLLACDDSLRNWMTTIRRQTHEYVDADYSPFECSTVRCIPAKPDASATSRSADRDFGEAAQRVAAFKSSLAERTGSKRNAVYFKDPPAVEFLVSGDETAIAETELLQLPIRGELAAVQRYLRAVTAFYITQVALSSSLHSAVLVCGDRGAHLLCNLLLSGSHPYSRRQRRIFAAVLVAPYTGFSRFLIDVREMSAKRQLSAGQGATRSLAAPESGDNAPEDRTECGNAALRSRSSDNAPHSSRSGLERGKPVQKTDYSSTKTSGECIYQPIWMFNTVGIAESDANDELCDSVVDESIIDDCSEWEEVTDAEFVFSNDRFDSTAAISHGASDRSAKPQRAALDDDDYTEFVRNRAARSYQTVCVLYSADDAKFNKIIYDYNGNSSIEPNAYANESETSAPSSDWCCDLSGSRDAVRGGSVRSNGSQTVSGQKLRQAERDPIDSVVAWKAMLRSADYVEDEEDLVSDFLRLPLPRRTSASVDRARMDLN